MSELTCLSCGLCKVCSSSKDPHDCPYPAESAQWHRCPKRTAESNSSAKSRARSARDSEAENSGRDME